MFTTLRFLPSITILLAALSAAGANVDLSTVPRRDTVQLTIYNSEDLTLVRETRVVTFKQGLNPLQFSWANTLIDPSSVELRFLSSADKLDVLDATFPHDKPQMLVWNVKSDFDGEATIEITYFTSGITWSSDYICVASQDERTVNLEGFVRVTNQSGEEYENAEVRLVVGTINLVEKIAQLAQIPMADVAALAEESKAMFKADAVRAAFGAAGGEMATPAEKTIIKEGLSEYFIYTVEGTETIPNGWSKRMRSFEADDAPIKIEYRYRPQEYGEQLVRMYLLANSVESKLGTTPLPDGVVRVFRDNGRGGLSYLAQQAIKYVPIGEKIELNLGTDPEVVFELVKLQSRREMVWMQINGTNTFQEVGRDATEQEVNSTVVGWSDRVLYSQRVRNYTNRSIDVEIRHSYDGHIDFRSQLEPQLYDYRTVEFHVRVEPEETKSLPFEVIQRQGRNAKQNNVTLEAADVPKTPNFTARR
jgi:hypothetical protein